MSGDGPQKSALASSDPTRGPEELRTTSRPSKYPSLLCKNRKLRGTREMVSSKNSQPVGTSARRSKGPPLMALCSQLLLSWPASSADSSSRAFSLILTFYL